MAKVNQTEKTGAAGCSRSKRHPRNEFRIDLNTVPSAMEQLAESWKGNR